MHTLVSLDMGMPRAVIIIIITTTTTTTTIMFVLCREWSSSLNYTQRECGDKIGWWANGIAAEGHAQQLQSECRIVVVVVFVHCLYCHPYTHSDHWPERERESNWRLYHRAYGQSQFVIQSVYIRMNGTTHRPGSVDNDDDEHNKQQLAYSFGTRFCASIKCAAFGD